MGRQRRTWLGAALGPALLLPLLAGSAWAHGDDPDRWRTENLVGVYERAEAWPVKALSLLALGERWHPAGAAIVRDAVRSGDPRLQAFALEALRATKREELGVVLLPELVEALVDWQSRARNDRVRVNLLLLLGRAFPDAGARKPSEWQAWWRTHQETYEPAPWVERPPPERPGESKTVPAPSIAHRALDLSQEGLQVVLVIDSTGSMQPTINAARRGLHDIIALLAGLAPEFELGLVHYRDHFDFPGPKGEGHGAVVLSKLTKHLKSVRRKLDQIQALGGGDYQERVASGLWRALQRKMGWKTQANKLIVLIGDAPPQEVNRAADLAILAHREPEQFLRPSRRVTTGPNGTKREDVRPFVVAAIAVGQGAPAPDTARAFRRIAKAGGGVYAQLSTLGDPREVSAEIVRRILELSFGARHVKQARRLVDIYRRYRDAGFIKD